MVAVRCWWRGKRSRRNGQDKCSVEDTKWRKKIKVQWRAKEQAVVGRDWDMDMERDEVFDKG